jgi:hypothetical protein
MEDLTLNKTRISLLWLLAVVGLFGYATIASHEANPEFLSNISLVTDQEVATLSVVLMIFAVLSLTLKGSTNRLTNIIAGSIVGIGTFIALVDAVTVNPYGYYNLMMGAVVASMVLIVWLAYKIPQIQA